MKQEDTRPEPTPGPTVADDEALGRLLASAHFRCRSLFDEVLRQSGLESRHFSVLLALRRLGPASQRRLIDSLGVEKSAMVRILDELERQGLAERRPDPRDRRAHAVHLTDGGRERLADAEELAAGAQPFGALTASERRQLATLLGRLAG
ncbi:MarR family winged helix-turn-helix transcriptional regulator [Yinghuangia sp. YIM S10712]|uniref:MarR family winged helix-turn-helix transcriptional regulator n=1 Tax=Yinghuangia sp. YIM S10712 TaxID=3436930 RepID=UPI003F537A4B